MKHNNIFKDLVLLLVLPNCMLDFVLHSETILDVQEGMKLQSLLQKNTLVNRL